MTKKLWMLQTSSSFEASLCLFGAQVFEIVVYISCLLPALAKKTEKSELVVNFIWNFFWWHLSVEFGARLFQTNTPSSVGFYGLSCGRWTSSVFLTKLFISYQGSVSLTSRGQQIHISSWNQPKFTAFILNIVLGTFMKETHLIPEIRSDPLTKEWRVRRWTDLMCHIIKRGYLIG